MQQLAPGSDARQLGGHHHPDNGSHHHHGEWGDYSPSTAVTITLVISCGVSALACLWIFFTFWRYKVLRRHPNGLILFRSICDLVFCVEVVASHLFHRQQHFPPGSAGDCSFFSGFSQYFGLAAELYVLFLAVDLVISVHNPFADYRWNSVWYHGIVHTASAVGVGLILTGRTADGLPLYGQDNYLSVCWIRQFGRDGQVTAWWWGLFNVPVGCIYLFMILTFLHVRSRLHKGLPASLSVRKSSLTVGSSYLCVYALYWTLAGVWYMVCFVVDPHDPPLQFLLIFTCFFGCRGVVTMLVWMNTDEFALVRKAWSASAAARRSHRAALAWARDSREASLSQGPKSVPRPLVWGASLPNSLPIADYASLLDGAPPMPVGREGDEESPWAGVAPTGPSRGRGESDTSAASESTVLTVDLARMTPVAADAAAARQAELRWKAVNAPDLRPYLNVALRKEIIFYTTLGIRVAVAVSHARRSDAMEIPPAASRRIKHRRTREGHADVTIRLPRKHEISGWSLEVALAAAHAAAREEHRWHDALHALAHDVTGEGGPLSPPLHGKAGPPPQRSVSDLAPGADAKALRGSGGGQGQSQPMLRGWAGASPVRHSSLGRSKPSELGMRQLLWLLEGGGPGSQMTPPTASDSPRLSPRPSALGPAGLPREEEEASWIPWCSPFDLCCPADTHTFRFHDLAPDLFAEIRAASGVSDEDYIGALEHTKREKFSEGASGAFLYFSSDERFIVKTMTQEERSVLLSILPAYAAHLQAFPGSTLTRWLGCHTIVMYGTAMHFIVMKNVLYTGSVSIQERYDLKGSWVQRHRMPLERGARTSCRYCRQQFTVGAERSDNMCPSRPNRTHVANTVLKDNDLNQKLHLPAEQSQALGRQLIEDVSFLAKCGIMDYSLLVGVHRSRFRLTHAPDATPQHRPAPPGYGEHTPAPATPVPKYDEAARTSARAVSHHLDAERAARLGHCLVQESRAMPAWGLTAEGLEHPTLDPDANPDGAPPSRPSWSLQSEQGMPAAQGVHGTPLSPSKPSPVAVPASPGGTVLGALGPPPATRRATPGPSSLSRETAGLRPVTSHGSLATLTSADPGGGVYVEEGGQAHLARARSLSRGSTGTSPIVPLRRTGSMGRLEGSSNRQAHMPLLSLDSASGSRGVGGGGSGGNLAHLPLGSAPGDIGLRAAVIEAPSVYYIGLIDILQRFTWRKWLERAAKTTLLMRPSAGVSAVPPDQYAARFRARVVSQLLHGFVDGEVHPDHALYAPYLQ